MFVAAPSWSWASFDGQFSFLLPEEKTVHPLRASIVTSTDGARVLGLTDVPVFRIGSVQTVPDDCHFTEEDLQQGAYPGLDSGFLPKEGSETCTQCKPGQFVHLYARDPLGHMCGLLQLDQEGHPPSDFEALVLFEQERVSRVPLSSAPWNRPLTVRRGAYSRGLCCLFSRTVTLQAASGGLELASCIPYLRRLGIQLLGPGRMRSHLARVSSWYRRVLKSHCPNSIKHQPENRR
jgi:hypothetical protein